MKVHTFKVRIEAVNPIGEQAVFQSVRDAIFALQRESEGFKSTEVKPAPAKDAGWISVEDRLPEPGLMVALLDENRWMNTGDDSEKNVCQCGYLSCLGKPYWSIYGERGAVVNAFTHWMPLPEAPNSSLTDSKEVDSE